MSVLPTHRFWRRSKGPMAFLESRSPECFLVRGVDNAVPGAY
jgi:hypothetical protein